MNVSYTPSWLGYDKHLAKFVIVVSSSRILNSLEIRIAVLRCDYFPVGNLSSGLSGFGKDKSPWSKEELSGDPSRCFDSTYI